MTGMPASEAQGELLVPPRMDAGATRAGRLRRAIRPWTHKPLAVAGGAIVLAIVGVAVFADLIAPYAVDTVNPIDRLQGPSLRHLMGTDSLGRDSFSLVVHGARTSIYVGFGAVAISTAGALIIGVVGGYYGGWLDTVAQRLVDMWMSFPWLVIILTIAAIAGPGLTTVTLLLGFAYTFPNSRVVRAATLATKQNLYVDAAKVIGAGDVRIMLFHILPNITAPVIILATLGLGNAILAEASLSFLGLGVTPPDVSWGTMLSGGSRQYFFRSPWLAFWPGLALSLAVFGFNMLGDGLRDVLDPRLRSR
ncbi:MAG: ABC transporter permease [Chloroflexi bacterium]|nr:ABC transporter permease [Chloroflexota bacterium]